MSRSTGALNQEESRDYSTAGHPTGWARGQLWKTTAAQYLSDLNSSGSALATMTADRDLWQSRANTAYDSGTWGTGTAWSSVASTRGAAAYTGGVWGSGILWSTEAANRGAAAYSGGAWGSGTLWSTLAGQAYSGGTWGSGTLWSTLAGQAYDGGTWGSGTLWSTRYTNAVAASLSDQATGNGSGSATWNTWTSLGSSLTVPYTGYYVVSIEMHLSNNNHSDDTDYVQLRVLANGGQIILGAQQGKSKQPPGSYRSYHYAQGVVSLSASTVLQGQVYSFSQNSDPNCTFDTVVLRARFIPTPANPH